jgi:hypothetical protein
MSETHFICSCCGKEHHEVPLSFAAEFPDPCARLSAEERDVRAVVGSDQCVIDHEEFYVRGCLEIPIQGSDEVFLWGVWAKIKESVYDEISDHWDIEGRERKIGPYKGLLANSLALYAETLNLHLKINIMRLGVRPRFHVEDGQHPLAKEQNLGISETTAQSYACLLLRMANQQS